MYPQSRTVCLRSTTFSFYLSYICVHQIFRESLTLNFDLLVYPPVTQPYSYLSWSSYTHVQPTFSFYLSYICVLLFIVYLCTPNFPGITDFELWPISLPTRHPTLFLLILIVVYTCTTKYIHPPNTLSTPRLGGTVAILHSMIVLTCILIIMLIHGSYPTLFLLILIVVYTCTTKYNYPSKTLSTRRLGGTVAIPHSMIVLTCILIIMLIHWSYE